MLERIEVVGEDGDARDGLEARVRAILERLVPGVGIATGPGPEPAPPVVLVNHRPVRTPDDEDPVPDWAIEASILSALEPRHIVFLCVANSARSQMAEGMARALAGSEVSVSSAGSEPSHVREEAIAVLAEIGLDIGEQFSKSVDKLDVDSVQLVVTLCEEEVCPTVLAPVPQVHWAIPDPVAVAEGEERLEAFRQARDEIRRRLYVMMR